VAHVVRENVGAVQVLTIDNENNRNAFPGPMAEELLQFSTTPSRTTIRQPNR
jgi:hypothetical protein